MAAQMEAWSKTGLPDEGPQHLPTIDEQQELPADEISQLVDGPPKSPGKSISQQSSLQLSGRGTIQLEGSVGEGAKDHEDPRQSGSR